MGCILGVRIVDLKSHKDGKFQNRAIIHLLNDPQSKIVDKISSFCEASDGTLWLGSNGYGLYRRVVDEKGEEHFEVLTQADGLVYNGVKGIAEDRNGRLWVTTQNGLSVYDPKLHAFTNYSQYDGLINPHFYWNSAISDAAGVIYLGTEGGLIEVTGEDISIAKTITLKESNRSFSISFSALDFGHERQGLYSYRMKGFDDDWTLLKPGMHSVRYSALPPGTYTFEVRYQSLQTIGEDEIISVEVVVVPAFWKSWWFRVLLSILFVILVIYIYNRWANHLKRVEAEQLLNPIRKVLQESDDPRKLQARIQNILDNQQRYKQSVSKSVEGRQ